MMSRGTGKPSRVARDSRTRRQPPPGSSYARVSPRRRRVRDSDAMKGAIG